MISLYVLINRIIDIMIRPLEGLHPLWPLTIWSVIMGVFAMIIYKYTSKQDGIKDAKERIKGHFYEVWLYIDDAAVIARAQARIFYNAMRYLAFAMPPLIIMIVLFFPLFANFETRYAMKPADLGEEIMVKVRLKEHFEGWEKAVELELPSGVELAGPPVRFIRKVQKSPESVVIERRDYEVDYRLRATDAGRYDVTVNDGKSSFVFPFVAGESYGKRATWYPATADLGEALLFPPENTVPSESRIASIEVKYPEAEFPFPGWQTWWVWPFLIISVVAALLVKGVFNVEI